MNEKRERVFIEVKYLMTDLLIKTDELNTRFASVEERQEVFQSMANEYTDRIIDKIEE